MGPVIRFCLLLLAVALLGYDSQVSHQPAYAKTRQQVNTSQMRQRDDGQANWVALSAQRERHALRLQNAFKSDVCGNLRRRGQAHSFNTLQALDHVAHNVPPVPQAERYRSEGPLRFFSLPIGKLMRSQQRDWLQAMSAHFASYRLVKVCDVHTYSYRQEQDKRTIRVTLHLSGMDHSDVLLEEHMKIELGFTLEDRLKRFRVIEDYIVTAPAPLFAEVTEHKIRDAAFEEIGFSPLSFETPGNLDFGGLSVVDVNGDDLLDIYVARSGPNLLYLQRQDGRFAETAERLGIADAGNSRGVVFADFDSDGDLDLVVANMTLSADMAQPLRFYRHETNGAFIDYTQQALKERYIDPYTHVSVADVDGDGDLDVFVAAYGNDVVDSPNHVVEADNGRENLLLINDGQFQFTNQAKARGLGGSAWSYAAGFVDVDDDGDQDLYLANDWGVNQFYVNDGAGSFQERAKDYGLDHPGAGMGVIWTDVNDDGRLDLYLSNMFSNAGNRIVPYAPQQNLEVKRAVFAAAQGNTLFLNNPSRSFQDATERFGLKDGGWAWGAVAFDYDLDGDEDIYQINGFFTGQSDKDL